MFARLKYFLYYSLALVSAFLTYKSFSVFQADAYFNTYVLVLNTVLLMLIWAFSFTSHASFVKENILLLVFLPLLAIYVTDLMLVLTVPGTDMMGYLYFVLCSSSLVFFSYRARLSEEEI